MNYRSAPKLVAIQHHIIASLEPDALPAQSADTGKTGEGECRLLHFNNDSKEGVFLADLILRWISVEGVNPEDICILTRQRPDNYTHHLSAELAQRGISARFSIELQDLLSEPLTTAIVDILRVCLVRRSPFSWERASALMLRLRGLDSDNGDAVKASKAFSSYLSSLRPGLTAATTEEDIETIIRGIVSYLGLGEFRRNHEQYLQDDFLDRTITELAGYLSSYRMERSEWGVALDAFEGKDSIPIMTIHKSKGLEYHTVVVVGLEDYPFKNILHPDREEDCAFFVAFSRAKKRVLFSSANNRNGRWQSRANVAKYDALLTSAGVVAENIA